MKSILSDEGLQAFLDKVKEKIRLLSDEILTVKEESIATRSQLNKKLEATLNVINRLRGELKEGTVKYETLSVSYKKLKTSHLQAKDHLSKALKTRRDSVRESFSLRKETLQDKETLETQRKRIKELERQKLVVESVAKKSY